MVTRGEAIFRLGFHWPARRNAPKVSAIMVSETFVVQLAFIAALGVLGLGAWIRRGRGAGPGSGPERESLPGVAPIPLGPPPLPVDGAIAAVPYYESPPSALAEAAAPVTAVAVEVEEATGWFKVPTRWYNRFDLPLAGFFFLVYFALVSMSGDKASPPELEQKYSPGVLIFSMAFQVMLAGLAIGFMIWRVRPIEWLGLRWRKWPLAFLLAPAAVFTVWLVMGLLQATGFNDWVQWVLGAGGTQESVQLLMTGKDPVILALMAFAAVVVAPLSEEIIFRGYLYPVAKRFGGVPAAMVFSSLVFAAAHGSAVILLPLFVLALLMCWLYERTGSLWASISVHFLFNGATVGLQLLARSGLLGPPSS